MSHTSPVQNDDGQKMQFRALLIGCIGIVYGDIGTSPLYAFREAANHLAKGAIANVEILGILSLIIWSLTIIVTIKYVIFLLRLDNKGEGGILSLMALTQKMVGRRKGIVFLAGVTGAGFFYGEAAITPAISVMSAIEGIKLITPALDHLVLPISMAIIIGLFLFQRRGTHAISRYFGPVMLVWFTILGAVGLYWIAKHPLVLSAFNPYYAILFLTSHGLISFVVLGSVFLAVTGAEALYTDLGHFGKKPIQYAWIFMVFPCLTLNYMGQGALLITAPTAIDNTFFFMFPKWALIPMVIFSTIATIIASQAVITGAYSIARQAMQLGLLPRLEVRHTSEQQEGQIYMPKVNTYLLFSVLFLCLVFGSSSALAAAYGIAITGTMMMTSVIVVVYLARIKGIGYFLAALAMLPFMVIEFAFFSSNLTKIMDGGIIPLVFGGYFVLLAFTWVQGTRYLMVKARAQSMDMDSMIDMIENDPPQTVQGTAIFLTSDARYVPETMAQNIRHNGILHEKNIILTIDIIDEPRVAISERVEAVQLCPRLLHLTLHFGYMETPHVPAALHYARLLGHNIDIENASFFLGHRKIIPDARHGLPGWQDDIYVAMTKSAVDATDFFYIPPGQVVEIGSRQFI